MNHTEDSEGPVILQIIASPVPVFAAYHTLDPDVHEVTEEGHVNFVQCHLLALCREGSDTAVRGLSLEEGYFDVEGYSASGFLGLTHTPSWKQFKGSWTAQGLAHVQNSPNGPK